MGQLMNRYTTVDNIEQGYNSYWRDMATHRAWHKLKLLLMSKKPLFHFRINYTRLLKRLADVVGASCAILFFSPIFLMVAVGIKLEDGGPIFFKQLRVGKAGNKFYMWKFRSMCIDAEAKKQALMEQNDHKAGLTFKMTRDPRITFIGRIIRKLSIDEFPQFFHVLTGEMSLVGPRPATLEEVIQYRAFHLRRLTVKPGITCLWQVMGRSEIDFEGQVILDLKYIDTESFWQDIKILVMTVPAVLSGKGAY